MLQSVLIIVFSFYMVEYHLKWAVVLAQVLLLLMTSKARLYLLVVPCSVYVWLINKGFYNHDISYEIVWIHQGMVVGLLLLVYVITNSNKWVWLRVLLVFHVVLFFGGLVGGTGTWITVLGDVHINDVIVPSWISKVVLYYKIQFVVGIPMMYHDMIGEIHEMEMKWKNMLHKVMNTPS